MARHATQAVEWYKKVAQRGHATAQLNLGVTLRHGQGKKQGMKWFNKAAEPAGVAKDEKQVEWYLKAVRLGVVLAQLNAGVCYERHWRC